MVDKLICYNKIIRIIWQFKEHVLYFFKEEINQWFLSILTVTDFKISPQIYKLDERPFKKKNSMILIYYI